MSQRRQITPPFSPRSRWLIWWAYLALWTAGLVLPLPTESDFGFQEIHFGLRFYLTKFLHLLAYTVFAVLSSWLRVPLHYRWLLIFFLMFHASVTEAIQAAVPGRSGSLRDVLFNQAGIALGLLLTWRNWASKP